MILLKGDCLVEMDKIPDGSVDLILTDPPYGTTACKWDSVIPFDPMWKQLNRIIKANGAIVLFGSEPFSSALRMSNIKNYKYDWYVNKNSTSDFTVAKIKPMNYIETCSVFMNCKIKCANYFPVGLIEVNKKNHSSRGKSNNPKTKSDLHFTDKADVHYYNQKYTNYPKTVINANTKYKRNEQKFHPTQKPVALMEYLIKTYTNENETVLDFTMGSGTTGVACVNTHREFVGIEMDAKYFEIAERRINEAQEQMTLSFV